MSFSESMNQCIRSSLPVLFIALTCLSIFFATGSEAVFRNAPSWSSAGRTNGTTTHTDFAINDLLLGSQDSFFWFLIPLFGVVCAGICIAVNYVTLLITYTFALVYLKIRAIPAREDDGRYVILLTVEKSGWLTLATGGHQLRSPSRPPGSAS